MLELLDRETILLYTRCPICYDICRDTKTVMACLHRFCALCIEASLRINKTECPLCRARIKSRRECRTDMTFDMLIAAIYGNVKQENEESMLRAKRIADQYTNEHLMQTEYQNIHHEEQKKDFRHQSSQNVTNNFSTRQPIDLQNFVEKDNDEATHVLKDNCFLQENSSGITWTEATTSFHGQNQQRLTTRKSNVILEMQSKYTTADSNNHSYFIGPENLLLKDILKAVEWGLDIVDRPSVITTEGDNLKETETVSTWCNSGITPLI